MKARVEYYGNPSKKRVAEVTREPGGLTLVVFESGAECYYDEYDDALDVLSKAGYTDRIPDREKGGECDGEDS